MKHFFVTYHFHRFKSPAGALYFRKIVSEYKGQSGKEERLVPARPPGCPNVR